MALGGELRLSQSQTMTLAPQLRQGLHLLAMSLPELREELHREMDRNPAIEDVESTLDGETVSHKERESDVKERIREGDYVEDESLPDQSWTADADAIERRQKFFDSRTKDETLEEHLLNQIDMSDIADADMPLAEMLIGDLDASGYFTGSIPDIVMVTGETEERLRDIRMKIMALDPAGCCAVNLEECLLAQVDKLDGSPYQDEVREILEKHLLKDVAAGRLADVAKALGSSEERMADVLAALRTLEPRPGRSYVRAGKGVAYVNPEVHAVKGANGRWMARVDDRSLPDIRISQKYVRMLKDPATTKETRDYIKEKIAEANAFRTAIEHREETISNIAQAVFDAQPGFFEHGLKGLRPLTMQEIADKVGVHPTTVSRTVRDKYASTPKGTVELRKFFTSGVTTGDGEQVSQDAVVEKLKTIIDSEDPKAPYSDDRLSDLLRAEGFPVARRTVAKYRSMLNIPGMSARRIK